MTKNIARPHTIKKFQLIEKYTSSWMQKLLNYKYCSQIVFIDCMCNSGVYKDVNGNVVYGTPIRISTLISEVVKLYPNKTAKLYFNDSSSEKIELLKQYLPENTSNFIIDASVGDGNDLLHDLSKKLNKEDGSNYLLVYDPYEADVDWTALLPFLNSWGEVIINHMVSDSIRGIAQAKREKTITKYEKTYLEDIENLVSLGNDKKAYEERMHKIIKSLRINSKQNYFIASYPFFNTKNGLVYNLIHCTSNINGFKLYKTVAWQTFGGRSSIKNTHGLENQLSLDFSGNCECITLSDEYCYNIHDICKCLSNEFKGKKDVDLDQIYKLLDYHPVFPSDGFKKQIKKELKDSYGVIINKSTLSFK